MSAPAKLNRCADYSRWNATPPLLRQSQIKRLSSSRNTSSPDPSFDRLLQKIALQIKRFLAKERVRIDFYMDQETQHVRARVIRRESGKVIREIPVKTKPGTKTNIDVKT
jgi:uncharacterized FlaG/YvyC family protein